MGDYYKAGLLSEEAVAAAPEVAIFHYHLGMIYKAQNRNDKAKASLTKAIELAKNDFDGLSEAKELVKTL